MHAGERQASALGVGGDEARDGAGNAAREGAALAAVGHEVAVGVEKHVARGRCRGGLAVVERGRGAVGLADDHEAAAADVARDGEDDGEREPGRHRRIDGVAARAQHLDARLRRLDVRRDDHPVARPLRLPGLARMPQRRIDRRRMPRVRRRPGRRGRRDDGGDEQERGEAAAHIGLGLRSVRRYSRPRTCAEATGSSGLLHR